MGNVCTVYHLQYGHSVITSHFQFVSTNFGCSVLKSRILITVDPNFKRTTIWQFLHLTCWVWVCSSGNYLTSLVETQNIWWIFTNCEKILNFSLFVFFKFGDSILYHLWGEQMTCFSWYCHDLCFQWPDASTEYFLWSPVLC